MSYQSMLEVMELVGNANQAKEAKKGAKHRIRKCASLGLFAIDRSCKTCLFASPDCLKKCYCLKQYTQYPGMIPSDVKNETYWHGLTPQEFKATILRKRSVVKRFRFCTRGEALSTIQDLRKVQAIALECPEIEFWIPTKAWQSPVMLWAIQTYLVPLPNMFVLASLDPSIKVEGCESTLDIAKYLEKQGLSIMFTYNDNQAEMKALAESAGFEYVACKKTWEHSEGSCADCDQGCFECRNKKVFVHLKEH